MLSKINHLLGLAEQLGNAAQGLKNLAAELENPTPSLEDEAQASSPPEDKDSSFLWTNHERRLREAEDRLIFLEAGPPSQPASGRPTMAEAPPGEMSWTTAVGGWDVHWERTPTGITCTVRGTLPSQPPAPILPGDAEIS